MSIIKLPWQELVEDTYRSVFSQSKTALDLSGVWLMLGVLLSFLGFGIYPMLTPDDLGGAEVFYLVPFVLGFSALLGLSIFATRWTRWITLNHLPQPGRGMALGKAEFRVGLAIVVTLLLGVAPIIGAFLAAPYLMDQGQIEAALGAQVLGVILGAFLLARSGMAINLAALQIPGIALSHAWRLSSGQTLRLLMLVIITAGPAVLAAWAMDWAIAWAIEPMPDLLAPEMQTAVVVALTAAMGFLGIMLFMAAMGLSARSLILAGDDPWAGVESEAMAGQDAYEEGVEESGVLETSVGDIVEEPMPLSAYGGWEGGHEAEEPLLLRTDDMVDAPALGEPEQLVPVDSDSWVDKQPQEPAKKSLRQRNWTATSDDKVLGSKIRGAKNRNKQSWTRFLPTLEFDIGGEAWKLAVLGVLMIFGYLFLFTDVITDYLF